MSKREGGKKVLLGVLVIAVCIAIYVIGNSGKFGEYKHDYKVKVESFDNIYEGNNIRFYYMDGKNDYQKNLKEKYKLNEVIGSAGNEIEKAMAIIDWVNEKAEFNVSAMEVGKTTDEIMEKLENSKALSDEGYAIVLEETLSTLDVFVRKGTYLTANTVKPDPSQSYKVIEVWSKVHAKWVMIDVGNKCYMTLDDVPLSAVEVIENGLDKVNIVGLKNEKEVKRYKKDMNKYFNMYTMPIDSNKYRELKSNSYVTYVKNLEDVQLENQKGFISPMIFVNKRDVFDLNPEIINGNRNKDTKAAMILSKKDLKEDKEGAVGFTIGAFKDSVMLEKFYISINGGKYYEVKNYYDLSLVEGSTKITLSEDGVNPTREIVLKKMGK